MTGANEDGILGDRDESFLGQMVTAVSPTSKWRTIPLAL
jgi:hypothetical protein